MNRLTLATMLIVGTVGIGTILIVGDCVSRKQGSYIPSKKERIDSLNAIRLELLQRNVLCSEKQDYFILDSASAVMVKTDTIPEPIQNNNFAPLPDTMLITKYRLGIKSIYGLDNRVDVSCRGVTTRESFVKSTDPYINSAQKVCALIPKELLNRRPDGFYELTAGTLSETKYKDKKPCSTDDNTCFNNQVYNPTIKFANQRVGAYCTGFGYQKDQVITANHCFEGGKKVTDFYYVFGFVYYPGQAYHLIPAADVYTIKNTIKVSTLRDYTILQVDRPLQTWQIADLYKGDLTLGEKIYMAGHPDGLPLKLTLDARVIFSDNQATRFNTDLDAFHGNSGAPVFNRMGKVVGLLLKGDRDYDITNEKCMMYFKVPGGYNELVLKSVFIN